MRQRTITGESTYRECHQMAFVSLAKEAMQVLAFDVALAQQLGHLDHRIQW